MKKYKLDIALIERTKLLEGVLCQSLTFTNSNGKQWGTGDLQNPNSALTLFEHTESSTNIPHSYDNDLKNQVKNSYLNPAKEGTEIQVETAVNIANKMIDYLEALYGIGKFSVVPTTSALSYVTPSGTTNLFGDQGATVQLSSYLGIKYTVVLQSIVPGDPSYRVTDTFEIQYYIAGVENRYPLKPYSITDCICRCLELAQPLKLGELPKYKLQGVNYMLNGNGTFTRTYEPNSQAYEFDKITAPNFTMTQCTLREQMKVVGTFIHCEPRLGYDPDGTGLNYEENTIIFERYEKEQDTNLGERGYVYRGVSQSLNNYCTSVTTNVANLVNTINYADGVIKDPDASAFRTLRTDSVNVMLTESNSKIYTQFPIYDVIKVECTVFTANGDVGSTYDITPYVFEQHEYNNLSSYEGTYPYAKGYAIYYTQGQKDLNGLFFKNESASNPTFVNYAIKNIIDAVSGGDFDSENDWQKLAFRVSYIPVYSTMFSHGKSLIQDGNNNFTIPYAQSENLVESSYYGEHLKGLANRMGNIEQERTYILPDVSYLPKAGQTLDGYVIASVKHDLRHTHVKCTVALTKDFNRLSQYVGVNSHKRVSEVSEREAYSRDILIKEYAVVGDRQPQTSSILKEISPLICSIIGSSLITYNPITAVLCAGAKKLYFKPENANAVAYENGVSLPVISSAFGNAIIFSWTYKDNYSAHERLQKFVTVGDSMAAYQDDIPYCDYYGHIYWYDFALVPYTNPISDALAFANGNVARSGAIKYPDSGQISAYARTSEFGAEHKPILIEKDSREALNVNYEVEFISNRKDLILGSAIASKCPLIGEVNESSATIYFFKGFTFGKYPRTLKDVDLSKIVYEISRNAMNISNDNIEFAIPQNIAFDSWCIAYGLEVSDEQPYADENGDTISLTTTTGGEITIACNNGSAYYASKNQTEEQIYITISDTNLKGV